MEQLALFSQTTPSRKANRQKKSTILQSPSQWNLWTEQTDSEKEMALFFLDIRNFTPLVARHQAQDVVYIIKKLFSTFQNIIRNHHGRIIETTGDGFYAAFGFSSNVKEAVNEAVNSGMAILKILNKLNETSLESNLQQRIEVGIGVHVGKVATGSLQLGSKEHVVVMGYPVNVASRLQAATKDLNNNFIISSAAYRILENRSVDNRPIVTTLRGITEPCELHLIGNAYRVAS
jgi:adenylate cyclase